MAFKMNYDKAQLQGPKPVRPGSYTVRFEGFKPKYAKLKEKQTVPSSVNLNAEVTIISPGEFENRKVFASLNDQIPSFIQDFTHSFGVPFDVDADGNISFPGIMDADKSTFVEGDPATWKYAGPLVGKTATWELGVREYQGREQQDVRRFICAVPNCAETYPDIRHSMDMAKKS